MREGAAMGRTRFRPSLDECEEAIEFLEDLDHYDVDDLKVPESLRARVREYPEGSGELFIVLVWFGDEKPKSGEIPMPPGWRLDSNWFKTEIDRRSGNVTVWEVGLIFTGAEK